MIHAPTVPTSTGTSEPATTVTSIDVTFSSDLADDKMRMLENYDVGPLIVARTTEALDRAGLYRPGGDGVHVVVFLDEFRNPRSYGPTFLNGEVRLTDPSGVELSTFEVGESNRGMRGRKGQLQVVTQAVVDQTAAGIADAVRQ